MVKTLKIGQIELDGFAVFAPLAGISNSPTRRIARRNGASMVWTEMISADGLVRAEGKARVYFFKLLYTHPEERPVAFQIFGSDPECMARAAGMLAETDADVIDINMGCPVAKVVKKGAGVALMRDLPRAGEIIRAVRKAIGKVPLTVKMRTGLKNKDGIAVKLCQIAEAEGADAVIIHARSKAQLFSGPPDYSGLRECVNALKIPVIGNGGIKTLEDAERMLNETGCAGVMIGRGALGNPWIFSQIKTPSQPSPSIQERAETALYHLELLSKHFGEAKAVVEMRKHLGWYSRGISQAVELRKSLSKMERKEQVIELVQRFFV